MITIKLRDSLGQWHTFRGESKSSITQQCEKQGIDSPFACRAGACTVCACRVISGGENLVQNAFGEKLIDTDPDQFLCCIGGLHEGRVAHTVEHTVELDYL